jgi:FkbM family methyltransferase
VAGESGKARALLAGPGGRSVIDHATSMAGKIWRHPENRGVRARRLAGWLSWQLWERTVGRPRVVRLHEGVRLVCHPHDQVTSLALYFGLYDSEEMRFLMDWLRAGDTFLDVGANVAPYSLLATLVDDVSAVAFEPESVARERAAANIALNHAEDRVTLVPCAVSEADGTRRLSVDRWAKNSLVGNGYDGAAEVVETVCLDSFVRRHGVARVSLIKIDVEGHEPAVLRGAESVVREHRPALIVECNDPDALQQFVSRHGYTPVTYSPRTRVLGTLRRPPTVGRNVILVADVDAARTRLASRVQPSLRAVG